jgi:hypothetical protein
MDQFLLLVVGFGPALISLTYLVSQCFSTGNGAMKCLVPLYLLIGTIGPLITVIALFKLGEKQTLAFWIVYDTLMVTDPFALFFFANFSMIASTLPPKFEYGEILPGLELRPPVAFVIFMFQTVVLLLISICIDVCRSNRFRKPDLRKPKKD